MQAAARAAGSTSRALGLPRKLNKQDASALRDQVGFAFDIDGVVGAAVIAGLCVQNAKRW